MKLQRLDVAVIDDADISRVAVGKVGGAEVEVFGTCRFLRLL